MKNYIGIVKIVKEYFSGVNLKIVVRFADEMDEINEWLYLYPNMEHIVMDNTEYLNKFFEDFEDPTPVTKEEKEIAEQAMKKFEDFMREENSHEV